MQRWIQRPATCSFLATLIVLSAGCGLSSTRPDEVPETTPAATAAHLAAAPFEPVPSASGSPASGSDAGPLALGQVTSWAYQLQGISEPGAVDALVASRYDMLVLEPTRTDWSSDDKFFDTREMVARLQGSRASDGLHRKLVIAYVDIGQAEDWRWYWTWSTAWNCRHPLPDDWPDYILTCDPDGWTGNYPVAYWDEDWQDVMMHGLDLGNDPARDYHGAIDQALIDGFDGVYLDWVEGYEDRAVVAAARSAGVDPAVEMVAFLGKIRDYATARQPGFLLIQQNAAELIEGHPELSGVIDAIAQEGIWFDGDATDDWQDPDGYDWENDLDLTVYYLEVLARYQDAGLPVFNCEYALDKASAAYSNSYARGLVPYVTRRSLSRLTTTPPPGY
jgi:cysteinyl-tRNA synthetase